jgi:hypothetical protein
MRRNIAWILSLTMLFGTGALGLYNGVRELAYTLTPLQRSVSVGVLLYGIVGVVAGIALAARHRAAVWLSAVWGALITYVASLAAIAYAGPDASAIGAVAAGIASAVIAGGVIWSARVSTHRSPEPGRRTHAAAIAALLLASMAVVGGCRQLYSGPPVVSERGRDDWSTKRVRAKREPDRLIAEDLSVCWVARDLFTSIQAGAAWRCAWRHVPEGQ